MKSIIIRKLSHAFGAKPLFDSVNFSIEKGDKVCLIGRNGMGKSTLLKILSGIIESDAGVIEKDNELKISLLQQAVPAEIEKSIYEIVTEDQEDLEHYQVNKILSKLNLDAFAVFSSLSGGLKRRVLLAKALAAEPDVLLLDEPTNHLDIESIQWLENFLKQYSGTLILVTHDRQLMQTIGNHFIEIDHGNLISWHGHYEDFLKHKEYILNAEAQAQSLFDKRLAEEEVWIRQGIKARRTRNEGRVRALEKMRDEFKDRRKRIGTISLSEQVTALSGKEVFLLEQLGFSYNEKVIIENFSCMIQRGDRIGILGPNGIGKSTIIKLLLQQLQPTTGTIKQGTKLDLVYYDQHRVALNEEQSIFDNVCEGSDYVEVAGKQLHIMSYLQNFLFSPERIRTPVKALSGGERNRVMLAKLFMKPSNLMILDEPTNDLDIETLELLEEQLVNYKGTVLLVSHDRRFLNNIVTSTLVFEGNGKLQQYAGGYDDWLLQSKAQKAEAKIHLKKTKSVLEKNKPNTKQLNFKEKQELQKLPKKIETLESELTQLQTRLLDTTFYKNPPDIIAETDAKLNQLQNQLDDYYARWEELEVKERAPSLKR